MVTAGQFLTEPPDPVAFAEQAAATGPRLGVDGVALAEAMDSIEIVDQKRALQITNLLATIANAISAIGYQSYQVRQTLSQISRLSRGTRRRTQLKRADAGCVRFFVPGSSSLTHRRLPMAIQPDQVLDCSGMACPMPILKTKKAVDALQIGQVLKMIATDPGSISDMEAWTKKTGHELVAPRRTAASTSSTSRRTK